MDLIPFLHDRATQLVGRVPPSIRRAAQLAVTDDRAFLALVVVFNLFLARRTFSPGLWADNDSVGHLAYATYLRDEFYPATGTFLGWCPKYNLGLPFLLFNTPPLLYVLTAATSRVLGISVLASLKAWMLAAFVGVPIAGAALVRSFDPRAKHLQKFALVTFSLFSSELFGLEFFFNNGMLNPAFGVPLMLATLAAQRRAVTAAPARSLLWTAIAGAFFAATLLTHTLSAYMCALALVGVTLGDAFCRWTANLVKLGATFGLGGGLAAFWLMPSLVFGARSDAAYTWVRNPISTVSAFFDGSLVSSYWGGFFSHFARTSNVGILAVIAAGIAIATAARARNWAVLGTVGTLVVALWVACGPAWSAVISIAPMYDRLLWYRFVTLVIAATLALASYGAWRAASRSVPYFPLNRVALGACAAWAALVMTQRAVKVQTTADYPQFMESVAQIRDRLNARPAGQAGRIFSEFLGFNVVEAASVNYPREMLPVLTGLDEVSGWIYENNPASQIVLKKGPFWYNSIPILELADRYDVEYAVAGSPNLVRAFATDPRWTTLVETADLVLFQRRAPSRFAEAAGWDVRVADRGYVRGGGYRMRITAAPTSSEVRRDSTLLVKTNASPGWRAISNGRELPISPADDGLIQIALPNTESPLDIDLVWDISELRKNGDRVSLAAIVAALALVIAGLSKRTAAFFERLPTLPRQLSVVALGASVLLLAARARGKDLSHVGFGVAEGMIPVYRNDEIRVGTFDDVASRPNQLIEDAWGPRAASGGRAERVLTRADRTAARITLSPSSHNLLLLEGTPAGARVTVTLRAPSSDDVACEIAVTLGAATPLPSTCIAGANVEHAPGVPRDVRLTSSEPLKVSRIEVRSDIIYLEAESFRNVVDDGGDDAFYTMGAVEHPLTNGAAITAGARLDHPIIMRMNTTIAPGDYEAWGFVRASHPRLRSTRGDIVLSWGETRVGVVDGTSFREAPFWDSLIHFDWFRFGTLRSDGRERVLEMVFEKRKEASAAVVDVDGLALVPRAASPGTRP